MVRFLALAIAVAACGAAINVPSTASGNVPFRVINDSAFSFCRFSMAEPTAHGLGPSWIDAHHDLPAGASQDLKIRPGVYGIFAASCNGGYEASTKEIHVDGPTEISLGGKPSGAPGVAHVALDVKLREPSH